MPIGSKSDEARLGHGGGDAAHDATIGSINFLDGGIARPCQDRIGLATSGQRNRATAGFAWPPEGWHPRND